MFSTPLMTLPEVANFLRLEEKDIIRMAEHGDLPSGKIGNEWRFRRTDIERWMASKFPAAPAPASAAVSFASLLAPERIIFLDSVSKDEALKHLCALLAATPQVRDGEELEREIFRREAMMTTGIGLGVGVPHVRLASVSDIIMAIGISKDPIADYKNLDGQPVRIICMIAAHSDQQTQYLKLLSGIAHLLKNEDTRQRLLSAPNAAAVLDIINR